MAFGAHRGAGAGGHCRRPLLAIERPILATLLQGQPPDGLASYTTKVTEALDLAIITPTTFATGILILRRSPLGYLFVFSLLVLEVMLAPLIVAQTASQLSAGVSFTPGEIIGPMVGFVVLAAGAMWVIVALLRNVVDQAPSPLS